MVERLVLYNLNENKQLQEKLSKTQYGFRAGVSTETALHVFVQRLDSCLAKKNSALGVFLDIMGAFENVTFDAIIRSLHGLQISTVLINWIENLLTYRMVHAELYSTKTKREIVKGNPQGGILSPFLWNCVLNNLLMELHSKKFYVQAYADDLAIMVKGTDLDWIRGRAQKAINIATE